MTGPGPCRCARPGAVCVEGTVSVHGVEGGSPEWHVLKDCFENTRWHAHSPRDREVWRCDPRADTHRALGATDVPRDSVLRFVCPLRRVLPTRKAYPSERFDARDPKEQIARTSPPQIDTVPFRPSTRMLVPRNRVARQMGCRDLPDRYVFRALWLLEQALPRTGMSKILCAVPVPKLGIPDRHGIGSRFP